MHYAYPIPDAESALNVGYLSDSRNSNATTPTAAVGSEQPEAMVAR
jgi:hypothetical protein